MCFILQEKNYFKFSNSVEPNRKILKEKKLFKQQIGTILT